MKALPTQEYLKECFNYSPETGQLIWKERPQHHFKNSKGMNIVNAQKAGKIVGYRHHRGYLITGILGQMYMLHRLIWKLVYGSDPETIDHIDGNQINNRINNLRNCSQLNNTRNKKISKSNKSGYKGVSGKGNYWRAIIRVNGKKIKLGTFKCPTAAHFAYRKAALEYFGEFARFE